MDPLSNIRKKIENKLKNAWVYLKKIKGKIKEFKSSQKKAGKGVDIQTFSVLGGMYGVKPQAYRVFDQKRHSKSDVKCFRDILMLC